MTEKVSQRDCWEKREAWDNKLICRFDNISDQHEELHLHNQFLHHITSPNFKFSTIKNILKLATLIY